MRVYYRGPDALVTDERFVWRASAPQTFAVRELHRVGRARAAVPDPRSGGAVAIAVGLGAAAVAGWAVAGPLVGGALGAMAMIALLVAVTARQLRRVHMWQVHATYRGAVTVIYQSTDERVFNQVTRALMRAIEDGRPIPTGRDLAIA
jgi:hypothetical protein